MIKLLNKKYLLALFSLLTLNTMNLTGLDCCFSDSCNRFYIGAFGGEVFSDSTEFSQTGVAFFSEINSIGPLAIDARGHSRKYSAGFGGVQIGYEMSRNSCCSNWNVATAGEIEALFYRHTHKACLNNPTDKLEEHDFFDRFPTDVGVYLINGVLALNSCYLHNFSPYIGAGIGAANIHIHRADSLQVAPPEEGVNHFDSGRSDTAWAFAAQAKVGLRYKIFNRFHIFAEYRYLFVDSSRFLFGSTRAPGHPPTTTWNVDMKGVNFNGYAVGLQFDI